MSTLLVLSLQEKALKQIKFTEGKIVVVGQKKDLVFHALELGLFSMEFELISKVLIKLRSMSAWRCMKAFTVCLHETSRNQLNYFWIIFQHSKPITFSHMIHSYSTICWQVSSHLTKSLKQKVLKYFRHHPGVAIF